MKQTQVFALDLTKADGNGAISCPACGNVISPDDCSEEAYSIIEPKVNGNGLEEIVIRCAKCASHIHLTGFSVLEEFSDKELAKLEKENEEGNSTYICHV
jgi:hypothetical protein